MNLEKKHFFLKLNPPRPSFASDMTDEEKKIMQNHVEYWGNLLNKGIAIAFGPVFDPTGGYGVGIISVDSEEQLYSLINNDPANGLNHYEFYPMRAVYKQS
jgi:uncharacterized protein YciI